MLDSNVYKLIHVSMKYWRMLKASYPVARLHAFLKYGHVRNGVGMTIKDAGAKGRGLYSDLPRKKGDLVFVATGPTEHAHFEGDAVYNFPNWYSVDKDTWVDIIDPFVFINHSCRPNLSISGSREFVALRDIEPGEELSFDYSITDDEPEWQMQCFCGESNCRRVVRAIQFVPEEVINSYLPHVPKYMYKFYLDSKKPKKAEAKPKLT